MTEIIKARLSASQHGSEDAQRAMTSDNVRRTLEPMTIDENPPVNDEEPSTVEYLTGLRLGLLIGGLMLGMLLFSIDRTIISTVGDQKLRMG